MKKTSTGLTIKSEILKNNRNLRTYEKRQGRGALCASSAVYTPVNEQRSTQCNDEIDVFRKSSSIILALDFDTEQALRQFVDKINPADCALKIGSALFTAFGPALVRQLVNQAFRIFLDLKFHDIPDTVALASKMAADLGVWMFNVHALGGETMMLAAKEAIASYGAARPLLVAVTVLTSFNEKSWRLIYGHGITESVKRFAIMAHRCGLDGVVCAGLEVSAVKRQCGENFLTVTPGIRLEQHAQHSQARVMTPVEAYRTGSDYIVVGRAVTEAADPQAVLQQLLRSGRDSMDGWGD